MGKSQEGLRLEWHKFLFQGFPFVIDFFARISSNKVWGSFCDIVWMIPGPLGLRNRASSLPLCDVRVLLPAHLEAEGLLTQQSTSTIMYHVDMLKKFNHFGHDWRTLLPYLLLYPASWYFGGLEFPQEVLGLNAVVVSSYSFFWQIFNGQVLNSGAGTSADCCFKHNTFQW